MHDTLIIPGWSIPTAFQNSLEPTVAQIYVQGKHWCERFNDHLYHFWTPDVEWLAVWCADCDKIERTRNGWLCQKDGHEYRIPSRWAEERDYAPWKSPSWQFQ